MPFHCFKTSLFLGGVLVANQGLAATTTDTFDVTATVVTSCSVVATNLAFGNYDSVLGTSNLSTVTSNCSLLTAYSLSLDFGGAVDVNSRVMDGPNANSLSYQLYQDVTELVPWGTGGDALTGLFGTGLDVPLTVYGNIPATQNVEAGSYTDTITVTLTF
jgi:spore coat protein U-like protein